MNTCGTCKFFGKACESSWDWSVDGGREVLSEFHVCDLLKHNKRNDVSFPGSAHVVDGSGYFAALCVKGEFGCNQWQQSVSGENGK